jgi:hypothetical protein
MGCRRLRIRPVGELCKIGQRLALNPPAASEARRLLGDRRLSARKGRGGLHAAGGPIVYRREQGANLRRGFHDQPPWPMRHHKAVHSGHEVTAVRPSLHSWRSITDGAPSAAGRGRHSPRTSLPEAAPRCGFRPSCPPCRLWQGLCLMGRLRLGMGQVWRNEGGRMVRSPGDVVQDCALRRFAPGGIAAISTQVQQIRKLCSPAQAGYRYTPSRRTPLSAGRIGATSNLWRGVSPRWSWRLGVGTDYTVVA